MEYDDKIKNRMSRIEGQIRGIQRMMDNREDCKSIISQISAARSALDKTAALIVSINLENCLREQLEKGDDTDEIINEAVQLLVKSR